MPPPTGLALANERHHFKTIINLFNEDTPQRHPNFPKEVAYAESHGIRYIRAQGKTYGSVYVQSTLDEVRKPENWPVLVHCHGNMDRTPAWLGMYRFIDQGWKLADILAAMQGAVFAGGGDYPANEFIIGSAADALLCRYKAGRRKLDAQDQLTLEWAGASAHYHAAMMRTIVIGTPTARHKELYAACRETIEAIETVLRPGNTFGTVFDVHARIMDERGLTRHRLNACGYSLGARFSPSWMEHQMFHVGNPQPIEPDMSLFVHMIIMDSDTGTAMTLGHTYLTTENEPLVLSRHSLDLINT